MSSITFLDVYRFERKLYLQAGVLLSDVIQKIIVRSYKFFWFKLLIQTENKVFYSIMHSPTLVSESLAKNI